MDIEAKRDTYLYDAFISYPFEASGRFWVGDHFIPELLDAGPHTDFGESLRIAATTDIIRTGEDWKNKLAETIAHSACVIAVVSHAYKNSKWCCWEWDAFADRTKSNANAGTNIVPILIWGQRRELEPPLYGLNALQVADYTDWWADVPDIRVFPHYPDFQRAVLSLVSDIYRMLRRVPPCPSGGWPAPGRPMPDPPSRPQRPRGLAKLTTMTSSRNGWER